MQRTHLRFGPYLRGIQLLFFFIGRVLTARRCVVWGIIFFLRITDININLRTLRPQPIPGNGACLRQLPTRRSARGSTQVYSKFSIIIQSSVQLLAHFCSSLSRFIKPALRGTPHACILETLKVAENARGLPPSLTPGMVWFPCR